MDVTAPVKICVGVDVCEADHPWPHTCLILTVTSCALGAAPVFQQPNILWFEESTAVLLCYCLSSATCFVKYLVCYTICVQALPIKQMDYLPVHSKSAYAGVKFTEGLWTMEMCLRGLSGTCEWVENQAGNKVLGKPIQHTQLFPCSREHLLLLFLQSISSVDHSC